jgi:O-antigen/teichoic acid export membrane protein
VQISRSFISKATFRQLAGIGVWFSLGHVAGILILSLDRIVAAQAVSLDAVTTLTLSGRLYALTGGALAQVTDTARPMLGSLLGTGKSDAALATYRRLFTVSTGLCVIAAASLWAGNGLFVSTWVGAQHYGGPALDAMLAANMLVSNWILPNRAVLSAALIVRPQTMCRLLEGSLNLGVAVALAPRFGLLAIAGSTAIAGLMTSVWFLPMLTSRLFERPLFRFLREDAARPVVLLAAMVPLAIAGRWCGTRVVGGYLGALLSACVVFVPGLLFLMFMVFNPDDRAVLVSSVRRATRHSRAQEA